MSTWEAGSRKQEAGSRKQEAGSRKQFASAFSLFESGAVLYAIDRCANETRRLYRVLDTALHDEAWVAGDYSIADMAIYAWVVEHALQRQQLNDTRASFDAQARQCLFGTAA